MKNKWLILWLIFVAASYLIPWWNRVYFLWDDVEFLMRLRSPTLQTFLTSHQYQFHPVFQILYWLEIQLFGVNPAALLSVSVAIHIINIYLAYSLIKKLTSNQTLSLVTAVMVSFNKSFFTVIFWPTIQSNLILTTLMLIGFHLFFDLHSRPRLPRPDSVGARNNNKTTLIFFAISLVLAGLSFGFGIGAGFFFAAAAWIFWEKSAAKTAAVAAGLATGIISVLGALLLSTAEIQKDQILGLSLLRIFNIVYFTAVGVSQAVISRFFLPGFIPNIYSPLNISVMVILPAIVLVLLVAVVVKNIKNKPRLAPLFLFFGYTVIPYFIAALARSSPGALGGLAERYIYLPFFSFILGLTFSLSVRPLPPPLLIGVALMISAGHQIALYLVLNQFFL